MKLPKLVRDNIPAIIENSGRVCTFEILSENGHMVALLNKLMEESAELLDAYENKEEVDFIEELADVTEVMEAIIARCSFYKDVVDEAAHKKAIDKGRFNKGILLTSVG